MNDGRPGAGLALPETAIARSAHPSFGMKFGPGDRPANLGMLPQVHSKYVIK